MFFKSNRHSRSRSRPSRLALALALCIALPASGLQHGSVAPQFEVATSDRTIRLDDYAGKIVYLDFWASWCGPCKQSFPWMNEMQGKYGAKGLQIIGINLDAKREDGQRFLARTAASFTIGFDPAGRLARLYAVKGMPSSVLIGRDGKITLIHVGFDPAARVELEQAIVAALENGK